MKFWKKYRSSFLALLIIVTIGVGMVNIPGVHAEEAETSETTVEENESTVEEQNGQEDEPSQESANTETETQNTIVMSNESDNSEDGTNAEEVVEMPYTAEVKIDNQTLSETEINTNTIDNWKDGQSKKLEVKVSRNTGVEVDLNKNYILCLKVSDVLYFNGLPDASKINGVDEVIMKQNDIPVVNTYSGGRGNLSGFSPYSGEIRLKLDPIVENVTVTDLGISYNRELIGYSNGTQSIINPIQVTVVAVDKSKTIDKFTDNDKEKIIAYQIASANITTGSLRSSGKRTALSIDGFVKSSVNEQDVRIGKGDTITYAPSAAGVANQVYKSMTIQFQCPYITVEGKDYYLNFALQDTALSTNTQGNGKGFNIAGDVVYDAEKHILTYTFKDMYLGGHTPILYTPKFSWPTDEEVKDADIPDDGYKIKGSGWCITEQTCYTGAAGSFTDGSFFTSANSGCFVPDRSDLNIISSYEHTNTDKDKIAKREIYSGLTPDNGHIGALGFFDIHNNGAEDSPEVNVEFEFNTDGGTGANYYVTQVNLPKNNNEEEGKEKIEVNYTLTDGKNEITGKKLYTGTKTIAECTVDALRNDLGVDNTYYIKKISYNTTLKKSTNYHVETAHLNRNRVADGGLFFGYMKGNVGETAKATLKIKSVDGTSPITMDRKTKLETTETSTISDEDYIGYSLQKMTVDGNNSQAITAGGSTNLKFGVNVSSEEHDRNNSGKVNGYHIFRDGIFYLCLPDGVSITGPDQVTVKRGQTSIEGIKVNKLDDTKCVVNGVNATWWQIDADGINADGMITGNNSFSVEVQLATDETMKGISWDFQDCVAVRTKNQGISWGNAGTLNNTFDSVSALEKSTASSLQSLAAYLKSKNESGDLGFSSYNATGNVKLDIARAEAMLDVDTKLAIDSNTNTDVKLSDADSEISYDITISSTDGGEAKDFSYYIPVVSTSSYTGSSSMVDQNEFGVYLEKAVEVKRVNGEDGKLPYEILYTEEPAKNLNTTSIRANSVEWKDSVTDFSKVTAIKIVTKPGQYIKSNESYLFKCTLKYDNSNIDFESMAGSCIQWRSFGHYTYNRNGSETTNTYPSAENSVTVIYEKDYKGILGEEVTATLDTSVTGAYAGKVNIEKQLSQTFKKQQELKIKKVVVSSGTQLISTKPDTLTGAAANSQFLVSYNVNSMTDNASLLTDKGATKTWKIEAGKNINLQTEIQFSRALTDVTTDRSIEITVGNENIDISYRIILTRKVNPANASASGLAVGEHYQVPPVEDTQSIAKNSAFSAVIVVNNFVPGNNKSQAIAWKGSTGQIISMPNNTAITMMEISSDNQVISYWYHITENNEKVIDLTKFTRMSGNESYTYDTTSTAGTTLRYMFVVDFKNSNIDEETYQFDFGTGSEEQFKTLLVDEKLNQKILSVKITDKTSYTLKADVESADTLSVDMSYSVNEASGNDSYSEGRSLALVVTPVLNTDLPEDAYIQVGEEKYYQNSKKNFIIPIGTIKDGQQKLTLHSKMYPDNGKSYTFTGALYVTNSSESTAPLNGEQVATTPSFILNYVNQGKPSIKVFGTQVATASEWSQGQKMQFEVNNIPDGGTVTVAAYSGIDGSQKVTDILSNGKR